MSRPGPVLSVRSDIGLGTVWCLLHVRRKNNYMNKGEKVFILVVFGAVVLIWATSGFLIYYKTSNPGTFGDMFGAINALFSGLAFAGLIHTIRLQQRQIQEANKEYYDNAHRHQESIRLHALTVLLEEYKNIYVMREEEHRRFIGANNNTPEGLKLLNEAQTLKNRAFDRRITVLQELEKAAGLKF